MRKEDVAGHLQYIVLPAVSEQIIITASVATPIMSSVIRLECYGLQVLLPFYTLLVRVQYDMLLLLLDQ